MSSHVNAPLPDNVTCPVCLGSTCLGDLRCPFCINGVIDKSFADNLKENDEADCQHSYRYKGPGPHPCTQNYVCEKCGHTWLVDSSD